MTCCRPSIWGGMSREGLGLRDPQPVFSPLNPQQVASKSSGIWVLGVGELVGAGNISI